MKKIEARSVIKFLHLKGYTARQIHDEWKSVYDNDSSSYDTAVRWKSNFQTGHMSLADEPRSGRPSLTDDMDVIKKVETLVEEDCWSQGSEWKIELAAENLVNYSDPSGNVMTYQLVDGVNVTLSFPRDLLEKRKHFKFRDDDIYLPGFPRTGTNWTNEIVTMLVRGKAEYLQGGKPHLELITDEQLEALESPRIINAHTRMSEAPEDIKVKKIKTIFTLRDPKDVAVSIYKITAGMPWSEKPYNGSFADYLHLFLTGKVDYNGLFAHWRAAEKFFDENPDCPVHYQVYEETIKDPVGSVQRLSDFLGLKRDDKLCKEIADKCSFSKLKAGKDKFTLKMNGEDILYRQGKSGDWKNYFTVELLEKYYKAYDEAMVGSKFFSLYARKA